MAEPALHFAVGATCATVITLVARPLRRRWYLIGPLLAVVGGVWACLPDVNHLAQRLHWGTVEKMVDFDTTHTHSVWWDIFFFHHWLDRHWSGRGTIIGMVWIVALLGAFFWLSARRIGKLENQLKVQDGPRRNPSGTDPRKGRF